MKALFAHVRRLLPLPPIVGYAMAALSFLIGLYGRYVYVLKVHRPMDFAYSDMGMYLGLAKRFAKEGYELKPYDVTHPPGLSELMAHFYRSDETLANLTRFQFGVTAAVPLAVGALGWLAFDRKTGLWALALSSLYFPFIDYGGYWLAEIYITLLASLTLAFYFGAVRAWEGAPARIRLPLAIGLAAFAGVSFSLAMLMKMVAAPAILAFLGLHLVFTRSSTFRRKLVLVAVVLAAAAPLCKWQADRCTRGNEGKFCPGSNKAAADFLMGHIGRVQSVTWIERDPNNPKRIRGKVNFGSPAAYQHGYGKKVEFEFKITDSEKNSEAAWKWIRKNPFQAIVLSFEHVWDSFGGSLPWPTVATKFWPLSQTFHYLFLIFLFIPSLMLLLDVARSRGALGLLRSTELAVFAPIVGVIISVMIATGEARYRIPWDMCFIVLAIQFYRGLRIPLREPVSPSRSEGGEGGESAAPSARRALPSSPDAPSEEPTGGGGGALADAQDALADLPKDPA